MRSGFKSGVDTLQDHPPPQPQNYPWIQSTHSAQLTQPFDGDIILPILQKRKTEAQRGPVTNGVTELDCETRPPPVPT